MVAVFTGLLLAVVGLLTYLVYKCEKIRRYVDQLPGPPSLPFIGNVHQLKRGSREFSAQLFDLVNEYGHNGVFRLLIGTYPLILVSRAEEAEPLMSTTKHMDKSVDYNYLHSWLGTGLLTSTGDKWRARRKLLTPTFHFKILHDFLIVFNEQSKVLIKKLEKVADGKTDVNVFNDVTLCALDIICETAMGRTVNAQLNQDSDYVQAVYRASEYIFLRQRTPWYWPDFLFDLLGPGKDHKRCLSILHKFTEQVIREKEAEFSKHHSESTTMEELLDNQGDDIGARKRLAFLDMLLCANADGERLSFLDIREEVDTFMFEGHDTTAMASNWALHLIGMDPVVQEKVHRELDAIFGDSDRDASMDDLKEMKYLECCIKEALRIFPSVPVYGRSLTEPTKIGGVMFDKGTSVLIAPAALHRDTRYFPDPDVFDPDRFLLENCANRHPYAYIPFSAGVRNCIGQKFALLEEKVILSTVLRQFSIKSTQKREELHPLAELILRPENGIRLILTKRHQSI